MAQPTHPPPPVALVEDDEVFPVHPFDDSLLYRNIVPCILMRFPSVLDPVKVRSSLEELLRMGDWRKLGGRLRLDEATDRISIHVPRQFTPSRPAIRFLHTDLDNTIGTHPAFASMGRSSDTPLVQDGSRAIPARRAILEPPGWPTTGADFLNRDEPVLAVRMLTFADASVMAMTVSHIAVDGGTFVAMLSGWLAILDGRPADVPPVRNAWRHSFEAVVEEARKSDGLLRAERSVLEDKRIDMGTYQVQSEAATAETAAPTHWNPSEPGSGWRSILLPAATVSQLMQEASKSLPPQLPAGSKWPFSVGDVVQSWVTRTIGRAITDPSIPVTLMRAFDARAIFIPSVLPPGAYLGNMFHILWQFCPRAGELARMPLGDLALQARAVLRTQATPSQVAASLVSQVSGGIALYGEPHALVVGSNSWDKIGAFRNADFKTAVVVDEKGAHKKTAGTKVPAGKPDYVEAIVDVGGAPQGPVMTVMGSDWDGNTWMHGYQTGSFWKAFEKEVERLAAESRKKPGDGTIRSKL